MQAEPQLQKRSSYTRRLGWLVLVLFTALLVFPKTRRLIQIQLEMETLTFSVERDTAAERAAAARLPNDYPVQLAFAIGWPWVNMGLDSAISYDSAEGQKETQARLERIAALVARFPDRPSAYACQLRYLNLEGLSCWADPYNSGHPREQVARLMSPESLLRFIAAAQKGAQLDPENAYFPLMRAVGLFAAHRDTEALEAVQAAAHCPRWNDYEADEAVGLDRLQCEAYGDRGAAQRLINAACLVMPQYPQVRALTDRAIDWCIAQEKAGNYAQGIAIRHAVMQCGSLIRSQAASSSALLVGAGTILSATRTPVGIAPTRPSPKVSRTQAEQQAARVKVYLDYLESQGQEQELVWTKAELAASDQAKENLKAAGDQAGLFGKHFFDLSLCWLDNLALLGCALVLLILGGAAHLAAVVQPKRSLGWLRAVSVMAIIGGIWFWQWSAGKGETGTYITCQHIFSYTMGDGANGAGRAMYAQWGVVGLCILTPVALVGLLGAISLRQRVPLATGIGRGLRGIAVPAALTLLLLYGISLLSTVRTEADLDRILARAEHNEVQELMERSHRSPGRLHHSREERF